MKNLDPKQGTLLVENMQRPELRKGRIYFNSGSAQINPSYTSLLNRVAGWMFEHPEKKVLLTAYTDATGSPQTNSRVAQSRLDAVKKALISRGIESSRFEEKSVLGSANTGQNSMISRRVEIEAIQ